MLVELNAFNQARHKQWWAQQGEEENGEEPGRAYNGLACPECGSELSERSRSEVKTSAPGQIGVCCDKCSYRGYRTE